MSDVQLRIKRLDPDLPLPAYAHEGDAGLDLVSAVGVTVMPGARQLVGTGIAIAIPEGYAGFVLPKSGRALKEGLSFPNTPGLIDAHYRGELKVVVVNLDPQVPIEIARGQKIGQLVIQRVERVVLAEVDALDETVRGEGGFGSTGI